MYLDHAEVAVEEAPVLRVLAALDVVGHGQEDVAGGSVVEVEHVLRELLIGVINPTHPGIYKYMSRSDESTCVHLLQVLACTALVTSSKDPVLVLPASSFLL